MPSRLLIGVSGWLLGAVTATAGSLYAVDQLGQGLLAQHSKRVSVAMVNAELAQVNSERSAPAVTHPPTATPSASSSRAARPPSRQQPRHQPPASTEAEFSTPDGTAGAVCKQHEAYLLYESPAQGYYIDDPRTGPATMVSVTFTNSSGGAVLQVTCSSSGSPVKHVSMFSSGSHGEE